LRAIFGVPLHRTADILRGNRVITADMAERLGRYFRISAAFWMNLHRTSDLRKPEVALG
jgi:antitoxin HigA-1